MLGIQADRGDRSLSTKSIVLTLVLIMGLVTTTTPPAALAEKDPEIIRDFYGVPHIFASDTHALFYSMGRVVAEDRLWQAELLRRSATGQLSELFGPSNFEADRQARQLFGPESRRTALYAAASSEIKEVLNAYVAGINEVISEAATPGDLAPEFGLFGFAPEPWVAEDSIAVLMSVGSFFGWFGADELYNAQVWFSLVSEFGVADAAVIFSDLYWLDDPDAPTTVPADGAIGKKGRRAGGPLPGLSSSIVEAGSKLASQQDSVEKARANAGLPVGGPASNALAISSRLSQSGSPLLLGGPQLNYSVPGAAHEVGLHGSGLDVTGMSIAGIPAVLIGVGNGYSWTLTSGGSDNTDFYAETLNPADQTQYLYEGDWVDMECVDESIVVAGAPSPIIEPVCRTLHGPVLVSIGDVAYSFKNVTVGGELDSLGALIGLGGVHNIHQFEAKLPEFAYNFNVLYGDRTGNIAYWHAGHIPIRPAGTNPFFPLDGTGGEEWQGTIPWTDMPHSRNPEQGWLANWNNKPAPGWQNSTADFYMWGGAHRVNTFINEAQEIAPRSATVETLEAINRVGGETTTTPSGVGSRVFVSSYLEDMLAAVDESADPRLPAVVAAMGSWDRLQVDLDSDGFYDRPWGTIFNQWWRTLALGVFDEVAPVSDAWVIGNLIDRMLRGQDAALPLGYDYLEGATVEQAVTLSLIAALDELAVTYGSPDPATWSQPIALIEWEPQGAGTVPDTIWMNRGAYNQLVHLRGKVEAWNVVPPGQSGNPFSPHFSDQLGLYTSWTYKAMNLGKSDLPK